MTIQPIDDNSDAAIVQAARELLLEYGRFVLAAKGPAQFCFGALEDESNGLPGSYQAQGGELLLAFVDGEAAGCVGYRAMTNRPGACEMKRLWVRSAFRGQGLGERLTLEVFERARSAGYSAVYLDTVPEAMGPAYQMYLRNGFTLCDRFNDSVVEGIVYMQCNLTGVGIDDRSKFSPANSPFVTNDL
ncbi:MAG: GNAT family N-acetyltransferase [Silvibacterium sp.]